MHWETQGIASLLLMGLSDFEWKPAPSPSQREGNPVPPLLGEARWGKIQIPKEPCLFVLSGDARYCVSTACLSYRETQGIASLQNGKEDTPFKERPLLKRAKKRTA